MFKSIQGDKLEIAIFLFQYLLSDKANNQDQLSSTLAIGH